MDERLLEVYELAMMGDVEAAREMLSGIDAEAEDLEEMNAYLDSVESGEATQDAPAMAGVDAMGALTGATPLPGASEDDADSEEE